MITKIFVGTLLFLVIAATVFAYGCDGQWVRDANGDRIMTIHDLNREFSRQFTEDEWKKHGVFKRTNGMYQISCFVRDTPPPTQMNSNPFAQ